MQVDRGHSGLALDELHQRNACRKLEEAAMGFLHMLAMNPIGTHSASPGTMQAPFSARDDYFEVDDLTFCLTAYEYLLSPACVA